MPGRPINELAWCRAEETLQRLMLQHNIEDVEEERVIEAIKGEWMNVDRGDLWEIYAAGAVAKLFNCRSLIIKRTGAHQFVGKPDNVEACDETRLCGVFLAGSSMCCGTRGAARLQSEHALDSRGGAYLRSSSGYACSLRVHQRCEEIVAKARNDIPAHMALVVIDQSLAAAVMNWRSWRKTDGARTWANVQYQRR